MKTVEEIKGQLDRKLTGFITGVNEFTYDNGSWVRSELPYSIYYTKDKKEHYILNTIIPEKILRKRGHTTFAEYSKSRNGDIASTKFVKSRVPKVKKLDIKRGFMIRYFVQPINQPTLKLTEISKTSFENELSYYKKHGVQWKIVGNKGDVIKWNKEAVKFLNEQYPNTFILMNFTEFWQDDLTEKEKTEKKLRF
jgi:hypothetical protein